MTWGKNSVSSSRDSFEERWPDLARGLDNALRSRRVPLSRREDIIQETGLRLFIRWERLDPERPVWPFALTIALNLMKDEHRMQARRSAAPQHVEDGMERGVEEEALARIELTDVQVALQKLTPAQRSVLLADLGELPYDDRGPAALKMLRMRARRTLRSVTGRASGLAGLAGVRIRRLANTVAVNVQRNASDHGQVIVLSSLGIAGAATIIGAAFSAGQPITIPAPRDHAPAFQTSSVARIAAIRPGSSKAAAHERSLYGRARPLRTGRAARDHRGPDAAEPAAATLDAGGTGIDDEPSLRSDRFRVWLFAKAAVSDREASVDYEVEQVNPVCGSPTGTTEASRTCIRTEPPRARGRARVGGREPGRLASE